MRFTLNKCFLKFRICVWNRSKLMKQTLADTGRFMQMISHIKTSLCLHLLPCCCEMFMHYISNETKLHFLLFFYQQFNPERYKAGENERAGWPVWVTEVIAQQTYWNAEDLAEIIVAFAKESRITNAVADILKLHAFRGKEGPESHLQYETECYVMGNAPETTKNTLQTC